MHHNLQEVTKKSYTYYQVSKIENEHHNSTRKSEKIFRHWSLSDTKHRVAILWKWSMLILCILAENQAIRFNTIGKTIPDISPKMLTETLKNLETDGLVKRKVYAEVPPRVEYSLTDLGTSLMPHLGSLIRWALENFQTISQNRKSKSRK